VLLTAGYGDKTRHPYIKDKTRHPYIRKSKLGPNSPVPSKKNWTR
jgi:hypothetical protein